jgi:bacterioferritin (cytochrome b1)
MTIDNSTNTDTTCSSPENFDSSTAERFNIEHIPSWNGKHEDKIVLSAILVILLVATALLWLRYQENVNHSTVIPKAITQSLTELSNASEEIAILQSLEGFVPSLNELKDLGIAPFSPERLKNKLQFHWQQFNHCFVATTSTKSENQKATSNKNIKQHYQFRLLLTATSNIKESVTYKVDWRALPLNSSVPALSKNDCDTTVSHNINTSSWHQFSHLEEEDKTNAHAH